MVLFVCYIIGKVSFFQIRSQPKWLRLFCLITLVLVNFVAALFLVVFIVAIANVELLLNSALI